MNGRQRNRILKFIVNGQTIKTDPNCCFTGIVSGSEGCLIANFKFSSEWNVLKGDWYKC